MQGLVSSRGRAAINKNSEKCKMILDESLLHFALVTLHSSKRLRTMHRSDEQRI